ncbi:hypothetical protein L6164_033101 [Bauhinia variegata]|uniref:Uncharacterized protein n=1 Tax=Bauhinia variegata TaxID=167791 RepID=A0ACB9KQU3_BAUVA|nr:hypothetical protein L6164_033101 [Bauhinia variegata]
MAPPRSAANPGADPVPYVWPGSRSIPANNLLLKVGQPSNIHQLQIAFAVELPFHGFNLDKPDNLCLGVLLWALPRNCNWIFSLRKFRAFVNLKG